MIGGLPISRVSEVPEYWNWAIYGRPGIGKTRFAGSSSEVEQMGPVLLLDIEGGSLAIRHLYPDIDVVRVTAWQQIVDVYLELSEGNHPYHTFIIDSLTEVQKFNMNEIMKAVVKEDPQRDRDIASVREWGKTIEQIRRFVVMFRDLPNVHTIFTALEKRDKSRTNGALETVPDLPGQMSRMFAGLVDQLFYFYFKKVDGEQRRLLLTTGTEDIWAKDRTGLLPPVIMEPTMGKVLELINNPERQEEQ